MIRELLDALRFFSAIAVLLGGGALSLMSGSIGFIVLMPATVLLFGVIMTLDF